MTIYSPCFYFITPKLVKVFADKSSRTCSHHQRWRIRAWPWWQRPWRSWFGCWKMQLVLASKIEKKSLKIFILTHQTWQFRGLSHRFLAFLVVRDLFLLNLDILTDSTWLYTWKNQQNCTKKRLTIHKICQPRASVMSKICHIEPKEVFSDFYDCGKLGTFYLYKYGAHFQFSSYNSSN